MTADASPLSATPQASSAMRGRWRPAALLVAAILAAFLTVAAIGANEAGRGARVLPFLDPVIEFVRGWGLVSLRWLVAHGTVVAWTVTASAVLITVASLAVAGVRAAPLVVLGTAVSLATWAQVLLLADHVTLGAWLYGSAMISSVILGVWCPITRLGGFPQLPLPTRRQVIGERVAGVRAFSGRRAAGWECFLVFCFALVALLTRSYALTEFPNTFDLETVDFMILSRTWFGFRGYLQYAFIANNNGIFHILTQMVLFRLFGTSIFTVRLTAVFWGVAAIPLFYWLMRRLAGVMPAMVSTALFVAAPDQLFWSRTENSFFAPVAFGMLVSGHLGLWMVERLSFPAVLASALWMPITRYFYTPSMVMFLYPVALYGHAVLFVRNAWRKAWYVVPVLAGGAGLWVLSLSVLNSYGHGRWQFIHPANVHGGPVWTHHGAFSTASWLDLIRLQFGVIMSNMGQVIAGAAYHGQGMFSHWYVRGGASAEHLTTMNVGITVLLALGIGYLLGQVYERRAFALLVWVALGLLPGVMSDEPSPRRIAVIFPAVYAISGVMLAAIVRLVRTRAGEPMGQVTTAALGGGVLCIVWTCLVSYFLIGSGPVFFGDHIRFARPVFEGSDAIIHNLEMGGLERALVFGNLDRFIERTPCYQHVDAADWRVAALRPHCDFTENIYPLIMPPERIEELRQAYNPRRISFVMEETPYSLAHIDLLRRLYPRADVRRHDSAVDQKKVVVFTVDRSDVDALHSPSLIVTPDASDGRDLSATLLDGVRLTETPSAGSAGTGQPGISVQGGLLVERTGWYQFQLEPECSAATLRIDQVNSSAELQPMLAGVHRFEITLPSATACTLPLQLRLRSQQDQAMVPVDPAHYVSLPVASVPGLEARPVIPYAGYGDVKLFVQSSEPVRDLGVDASGSVSVLLADRSPMRIQRFNPDGTEAASWLVDLPSTGHLASMIVDPDGTATLASDSVVLRYDRTGKLVSSFRTPWLEWTAELVPWGEDRLLVAVPDRNALAIFTRAGQLQREVKQFSGGPEFHKPVSLSISPQGDLLVVQDDGEAFLFRDAGNARDPVFVRAFHIDFGAVPIWAHGCAFDGAERILVPDMSTNTSLVYSREGERMMAATPERDLRAKPLGGVLRFSATDDRVYVLDRATKRLWSVAR